MAQGDEVLIVDGSSTDREGMKKLLEADGFIVSTVDDSRSARELLLAKFFPVVLIDVDVEPDTPIDVVRLVQERSAHTSVVLLTNRKVFELAVEAFRLGVLDVVLKRPDQIPYLRERVAAAADRYRLAAPEGGGAILKEVRDVLEESLKRLMGMARQVPSTASVLAEVSELRTTVLLIEHDEALVAELAKNGAPHGLEIIGSSSGGAGLDQASSTRFDVVAARETLPDLPGPMVVKSIQQQNKDVSGLVYEGPGPSGHIDLYERGRPKETMPFGRLKDLLKALEHQADQAQATRRERRFLQAFRAQETDFLKRYAELKKKIDKMLG